MINLHLKHLRSKVHFQFGNTLLDQTVKKSFQFIWNKLTQRQFKVCCCCCGNSFLKGEINCISVTLTVVSFAAVFWSHHATLSLSPSLLRNETLIPRHDWYEGKCPDAPIDAKMPRCRDLVVARYIPRCSDLIGVSNIPLNTLRKTYPVYFFKKKNRNKIRNKNP